MKKPPLESRIVKKILERLKSRGGFWIKLHGSPFVVAGLPDIIGCHRGRFVAFEVKREAGIPPKPIQKFMMSRIRRAGGIALLIHSAEQAETVLDWIDRTRGGHEPFDQDSLESLIDTTE